MVSSATPEGALVEKCRAVLAKAHLYDGRVGCEWVVQATPRRLGSRSSQPVVLGACGGTPIELRSTRNCDESRFQSSSEGEVQGPSPRNT